MADQGDDPAFTAELDQIAAGLRVRASLLAGYMANLVGAGFTRDEALALVIEYQAQIDADD